MKATRRRLRRAARLAALTGVVLLLAASVLACSTAPKPSGGLEVLITSDLRSPQDFDNLEVRVSQETSPGVLGAPLLDQTRPVPAVITLPTSVAITSGSSADQSTRIVVRGLLGQAVVVERTVQVQIPTSSVLELELFLGVDCIQVTCTDGKTCMGSTCQSIVVDPSQLSPYQPGDFGGPAPSPTTVDGGNTPGADGSPMPCTLNCNPCGNPGEPCCAGGACSTGTCNAGMCAINPTPGLCGPANCNGCCDPAGNCLGGTEQTACGQHGNTCMACQGGGACSGGVCSGPSCGGINQPCCPNGVCGSGAMTLVCGANSTCEACGNMGEPCCGSPAGQFCQQMNLMCSGGSCVQQCGLPGAACCPYNMCNQGCCENGTCTGQGSTCSVFGGVCAYQGCQGDACGMPGKPCCTDSSGHPGCTAANAICHGGTCETCGMEAPMGNGNCCPGDICANPGAVCSHDADAGTGGDPTAGYCVACGGYQQPCCKPIAGGPSANTPACQTGFTCTSGMCQ